MKRVLIVGAGRIAGLNESDPARRKPATHAGAVAGHPGLELAGFVDVDPARARVLADRFGGVAAHGDLATALHEERPDIVTVAVPHDAARKTIEAVAAHPDRPARLLAEKPLAGNLADAEAIVATCESNGIALLVNNECAAPFYGTIRRLFEEELNGEALSVVAWCSSGMRAIGIHMIGILRYLFGDIARVYAVAETEPVASLPFSSNFTPDDPRLHAMLEFRSGLPGFLSNSALTCYTMKEFEIMCRGGRLRMSDNGGRVTLWRTAPPGASSLSHVLSEPCSVEAPAETVFSAIAGFLADDDPAAGQAVIGGREGLACIRTLDALLRAAATGAPVTVGGAGE